MKIIKRETRNVEIYEDLGFYRAEPIRGTGYYYTVKWRPTPWSKNKVITIPVLYINEGFFVAKRAMNGLVDEKLVQAINNNIFDLFIPFDFFYSQLQESVKEMYYIKYGYKEPNKHIIKAFGLINERLKDELELMKCKDSLNEFVKHVSVVDKDGLVKRLLSGQLT